MEQLTFIQTEQKARPMVRDLPAGERPINRLRGL